MNKISIRKVGVVLGAIFALWHAMWSIVVFTGVAKPFLDWVIKMHFLHFEYNVEPFVLSHAVMLVTLTGVIGYVLGCFAGWLWNVAHHASRGE